jgi:hypothetical protein
MVDHDYYEKNQMIYFPSVFVICLHSMIFETRTKVIATRIKACNEKCLNGLENPNGNIQLFVK